MKRKLMALAILAAAMVIGLNRMRIRFSRYRSFVYGSRYRHRKYIRQRICFYRHRQQILLHQVS